MRIIVRHEERIVTMTQISPPEIDVLVPAPCMPMIIEGLGEMFRVHTLWDKPDPAGWIAANGAAVRAIAGSFHARPISADFMAGFPKLEIVSNFGVGYDSVDVAACARRGIVVTNTPDVLTDEVADLAMGLLLATVRQLPQADGFLRRGDWQKGPFPLTATLRGKKLGILALGRIGKAVAVRAEAFGLDVSYHGRNPQPDVPYAYHPTLEGMAREVDILLSMAPGGEATHRIINAKVLEALGPEGIFINVGRGAVVDEPALIEALKTGRIMTAGLDVFDDEPNVPAELVAMPHVVLLPHVGSASVHTRRLMGQLVIDNAVQWFAGKGPLTPVPETPWKPA
jgi:lactate dehydrogenase-like 2-hydroxyacid dehydrogenase